MKNKILRRVLWVLGLVALFVFGSWGYMNFVITMAGRQGVYRSAEEGMIALIDQSYPPDRQVKILYAGTNSFDGSKPHIWYVIAEVRASARADGSEMGQNGCDAPGSFFLQTKEGWVHVREGSLPVFVGSLMMLFDQAGEGQAAPSTNWAEGQNPRFCLE